MTLTDDIMKAARLAAQKLKDALDVQTLPAKEETLGELEQGSPDTPDYEPKYGQTMKDKPLWPAAKEQSGPEHEPPETDIDR